jgi:hypothetical protein
VPLDRMDFERRPYMPASGWPFGYETLPPYYLRANELCEAGEFAYSVSTFFLIAACYVASASPIT